MVMAVDASEGVKATPMKTVTGDGSKLSPKHSPGGELSQYEEDGTPKKKKETGPKGGMKKGLRYNPGFDPSKASETTGP